MASSDIFFSKKKSKLKKYILENMYLWNVWGENPETPF